jgi:hypothetical protein
VKIFLKETTRQIVLLFGVLTLLTSSYVVVSMADGPEDQSSDNTPENITQPKNDSQMKDTEENNPKSLIGKSIRGFELMMDDIVETMSFLSTDSGDSS